MVIPIEYVMKFLPDILAISLVGNEPLQIDYQAIENQLDVIRSDQSHCLKNNSKIHSSISFKKPLNLVLSSES